MNHNRKLGAYIRFKRKQNGLTLPALAERAEISKGGLSKIENGKGNPSLRTIVFLANALEIGAGQMLSVSFDELP